MPRRAHRLLAAALVAAALVGAACGSDSSPSSTGTINVFAAASLTAAFGDIAEAFNVENPDAKVVFSFGGSSTLVTQIIEGAPADVFASADLANMTKLTDANDAKDDPAVFTTNRAEIIVAAGNPLGLTGVADLARTDLKVVQCAPEVPCGAYAQKIYDRVGITVTPKSLEENVKGVVTKVTLGEADAGIVYATDVTAAGDSASGVEIPVDQNVVAEYPIVVTRGARNASGAAAFVAFVLGPQGQAILASYGFAAP